MKIRNIFAALTPLLMVTACAPKVYVIDRATILEEESGGDWPSVDQAKREKLLKKTPAAIKTSDRAGSKEKLTRILEPDESVNAAASPTTNPQPTTPR